MLAEGEDLGFVLSPLRDDLHLRDPLGETQRRLQRVGEPPLDAVSAHEAIDHHFDRVLLVPGEPRRVADHLGQVADFAVDAGTHVALRREVREQ